MGNSYLTSMCDGEKGQGMAFRDTFEAIMAHQMRKVTLHAKIKVRVNKIVKGEGECNQLENRATYFFREITQ